MLVVSARSNAVRREVVRDRIDVCEHWLETGIPHRTRGREKREAGHDDFAARGQVQRAQAEQDGIGTAGAADCMPGARQPGDFAFQLLDAGTHDEALRLHDVGNRALDIVLNHSVLPGQVQQRHGHAILK